MRNSKGLTKLAKRYARFDDGTTYNKRWQAQFRHAYIHEPMVDEPSRTGTPEQSPEQDSFFGGFKRDWVRRIIPSFNLLNRRAKRCTDPVSLYFLPIWMITGAVYWPLHLGFKLFTLAPAVTLYTRIRDKIEDPQFEETHMRELLHSHEKLGELFKVETTQILDCSFDYQEGFPSETEFPEFTNKIFRYFAVDSHMCKGEYVFGDIESNATVKITFETMPVRGIARFQVGEPFYVFDAVAELNHDGVYEKVTLVDREETLKKKRPFLMY